MGALGSTTTVCSPPLYVTVSFCPSAASTRAEIVPLVMVLPGARSNGRNPSPVPRSASGKTWTSIAFSSPPSLGSAATPMKAPGLTSERAAATTSVTVVLPSRRTVLCSPARVRTVRLAPSGATLSMVARAVATGGVWAKAASAESETAVINARRSNIACPLWRISKRHGEGLSVLGLGPERMGRVDAEDAHFAREEVQFLERPHERRIVGVAVDVGEELGGGKLTALHVAFELGHIDAVGGEAAKRLVEGGRHVAHPEDKSRHHRAIARRRPLRLLRQDDEAGRVVFLVLDVGHQGLQAVDLAGELGGERGAAPVAPFRHFARRAGGVARNHRLELVAADDVAALAERMDVAVDCPQILDPRSWDRQ